MSDLARATLRALATRMSHGTLLIDEGGSSFSVGSGEPTIHISVLDPQAYGAWLRQGSVGFAESYIAQWWETDDLTGVVRLLSQNLERPLSLLDALGRLVAPSLSLWQRLSPPSKATDATNVRAHYDLPLPLFSAMLDESMTYSCAVFEHPDVTLAEAQRAKLDRICEKLSLGTDDHVVEIGTGWGSFAIHAARHYGCRVTTTTLSKSQRDLATKRVVEAGLTDRVEVLGLDYRDLSGQYNKLVSIEMIEAVDWRRYGAFFAACRRLLKKDGLMMLQAIVVADSSFERAKQHEDFIRKLIFPGGCLPSIAALSQALRRSSDLRILDLEDIGQHYAATLRHWLNRLEARWPEIASAGFDEEFHRMWRLYLCYCEAAFLERHISDVQIVIGGPNYRPALGLRRT